MGAGGPFLTPLLTCRCRWQAADDEGNERNCLTDQTQVVGNDQGISARLEGTCQNSARFISACGVGYLGNSYLGMLLGSGALRDIPVKFY